MKCCGNVISIDGFKRLNEKKKILNKIKKNCCIIRNVTNLRRGQRRAKTKMIKIIGTNNGIIF